MRLEQALEQLLQAVQPLAGTERLPLTDVLGRVLARNEPSPIDLPPFANSAMDGYAVRSTEARPDALLRVIGRSMAGAPHVGPVGAGECVRVFTGASMPEGLDAVLIQEQAERMGEAIRCGNRSLLAPGENLRQGGEELRAGDVLLDAGARLRPADVGLLAAAGVSDVMVRRKPRVAFLATGDELIPPGRPLRPGCIHESNRPVMRGLLTGLGVEPLDMGIIADAPDALRHALLRGAERADALITMGGASVGDADYVVELLREVGQVEFWKIAIKPGKPFVFGRVGQTPVFGLPGNPVSMMVTFLQLVRPALARLSGWSRYRPVRWRVEARDRMRKSPGRLEFQRGLLIWRDGVPGVTALPHQGSHRLTTMSRANCFIVLPVERGDVAVGEMVDVEPFDNAGLPGLGA